MPLLYTPQKIGFLYLRREGKWLFYEGAVPLKTAPNREASPGSRAVFREIKGAKPLLGTPSCGYLVKELKGTKVPLRN